MQHIFRTAIFIIFFMCFAVTGQLVFGYDRVCLGGCPSSHVVCGWEVIVYSDHISISDCLCQVVLVWSSTGYNRILLLLAVDLVLYLGMVCRLPGHAVMYGAIRMPNHWSVCDAYMSKSPICEWVVVRESFPDLINKTRYVYITHDFNNDLYNCVYFIIQVLED